MGCKANPLRLKDECHANFTGANIQVMIVKFSYKYMKDTNVKKLNYRLLLSLRFIVYNKI